MYKQLEGIQPDDFVIVTSGCSYSRTFSLLKAKSTEHGFSDKVKFIEVGEPGRSNKWITQSIIFTLEQLKDHPTDRILAIAQLSSVDRRDLSIDRTSNEFHHKNVKLTDYALIKHMSGEHYYRQFRWYADRLNDLFNYDVCRDRGLLSITNIRRDLPDSKQDVEKFIGSYYKMFHNDMEQFESTLQSVVALQNYCKLRDIEYVFTTWQDIFFDSGVPPYEKTRFVGQSYFGYEHPNNLIFDYSALDLRINRYPELKYIYDQIDFSKWQFYPVENCPTGGIADWCLVRNTRDKTYFGRFFAPELGRQGIDPIHPSDLGFDSFCEQEYVPLIKSKLPADYFSNETKE